MTARHDGKQPMHPASTGQDHSALHPRPSSAQADSSDRSTSAPNATGVQRDALAENFVYYNDAKVNFRVCPLALEYEEAFRLPPRTAKALIDAVDIIGARLPLGSKNAFEWKDHKGEKCFVGKLARTRDTILKDNANYQKTLRGQWAMFGPVAVWDDSPAEVSPELAAELAEHQEDASSSVATAKCPTKAPEAVASGSHSDRNGGDKVTYQAPDYRHTLGVKPPVHTPSQQSRGLNTQLATAPPPQDHHPITRQKLSEPAPMSGQVEAAINPLASANGSNVSASFQSTPGPMSAKSPPKGPPYYESSTSSARPKPSEAVPSVRPASSTVASSVLGKRKADSTTTSFLQATGNLWKPAGCRTTQVGKYNCTLVRDIGYIIDYDVALYTQFMSSVLKYTPRSHQKAQSSIVGPCVRNVLGKCRFGNNCNRNRASESVIFFYIRCTNNNKDIPWGNCEHVEANVEIDKLPQACGPFSIGGDCTHDCVGAVPAPLEPDTRLMHLPQLWRNYALIAVNDIRLFKGTQQGYHAWWMEFAPMLKRFGLIPVAENII